MIWGYPQETCIVQSFQPNPVSKSVRRDSKAKDTTIKRTFFSEQSPLSPVSTACNAVFSGCLPYAEEGNDQSIRYTEANLTPPLAIPCLEMANSNGVSWMCRTSVQISCVPQLMDGARCCFFWTVQTTCSCNNRVLRRCKESETLGLGQEKFKDCMKHGPPMSQVRNSCFRKDCSLVFHQPSKIFLIR